MAKITYSGDTMLYTEGLDLASQIFYSGASIVSSSSTQFTVDFAGTLHKYTGTGLTYGADGRPKGGVITGIEAQHELGSTKLTGLHDKVADLLAAYKHDDKIAMHKIVLADLAHDDVLRGGNFGNEIYGHGGDDKVFGGSWNDKLSGNGGNDTLVGGQGHDMLTGGAGVDHFVFNAAINAANADDLLDFKSGEDKIDLRHNVFTATGPAGNTLAEAAFKLFDDKNDKLDASDRILYVKGTGHVFYDADGSGTAAKGVLIATLEPNTALTFHDIHIV